MLYSLDQVGDLVADLGPQREFERTSGLPWHRTVAELESQYGMESWRGFQDTVPLRGIRALGLPETVRFRHRLFPPRQMAPAYEFQAELNPHANDRANHQWALNHLTGRFGRPPRLGDVSNCLHAHWDFGLIEVSVSTFLREKRIGRNDLYDRHPDLWQVANLTVESRLCAYREPVELDVSDGFDLPSQGLAIGPGDFLTNRLLMSGPTKVLRLWRDRGLRQIGVANRWGSIIRPWNDNSRLVLYERTPARGGGSASLEWDGVEVLQTAQWNGLREIAARCAKWFGTPLETRSQPDE